MKTRFEALGGFVAVGALLVAIGLGSRTAPLLDQGGRLLRQFPTEDGYLMLTIARNVALGRGMSVADGTIATNGTQPLATYLWAACFGAAGGEKRVGVALVLAAEVLIASGAGLLLLRLGRRAFATQPQALAKASLAAAAWYASPVVVSHTMNALESGLYVFTVLLVMNALTKAPSGGSSGWRVRRWALVGFLLGVAFWARNDAVLLCGAVGVTHLLNFLPQWRASLKQRVAELSVAATATLLVAAPWLIHNLVGFGSIIPISGQAESLRFEFGENLLRVPPKLFEYLTLFAPIPSALEGHWPVVLGCSLFVAAATVAVCLRAAHWSNETRTLLAVGGVFTLGLCAFYGLSFGAGYFMSRYLFPASPLLALLWAGFVFEGWHQLGRRLTAPMRYGAALLLVALALGLNARLYLRGDEHLHFQVVEWVGEHVPSDVWVGAVQTGTLGFFHDRAVNLDGKVNPEALEARRENRIPRYVLDKEIQYLVDWVGIAEWIELPELSPHFELVVKDSRRNLAVLRRREAPSRAREGTLEHPPADRGARTSLDRQGRQIILL